ncbi:MAG TPA: hypothetical protein VLY24_17800 [Bryobacteraceae bacterium]|nr:hypothetical protein [Bryobacteraceae bacterium]
MPQPGIPPDWEELRREMRAFERRIARIEERLELSQAAAPPVPIEPATPDVPRVALAEGVSAIPVLGRALLGLAGAYVLRAITESRALPQQAGVFAGILYAIFWLLWAARTPTGRRVEAALYSLTSALVLGPLLWESTIRFRAISTWGAAAVLLVFTVFGLVISWRKNLLLVATIATLTGISTAAALLIGSNDVMPFTVLLLAIAAAVEASARLDHWLSERWLTAAAADLVVLLATYLVTNSYGLPEVYVPVSHAALLAAQMALLVIYLASTIVRTLLRRFTFTNFETAQLALAFLLAVGGGLRLTGSGFRGALAMAAVTLICAVACYLVPFALLARREEHDRNFYTYATFGILLVVAGSLILLPGPAAAAAASVLAIACLTRRATTLHWHGGVYLLVGLLASGALPAATGLLLGGGAGHTLSAAAFWEGAAALACYSLAVRHNMPGRLLRVLLAGAAFWLLGAIAASALAAAYHGAFGEAAPHAYCITLRTIVLSLGALLLGWTASWRDWSELKPLVYFVMLLAAYRLLMVDLGQDRKAALVFPLVFYGTALMILPRWMYPSRPSAQEIP